MTDSVRLTQQQQPPQSLIYQSGYNVSSTQPAVNPQFQPTGNYQLGSSYLGGKGYDATSSYQSQSSNSYQPGFQSSTYQSTTYQQGAYQPPSYQASTNYQPQPYQGSASSTLYGSSTLYKSGYQPPKSTDGGNKWGDGLILFFLFEILIFVDWISCLKI